MNAFQVQKLITSTGETLSVCECLQIRRLYFRAKMGVVIEYIHEPGLKSRGRVGVKKFLG
jgi:hypothetical protein